MSDRTYVGTELDVFAKAVRWKGYYSSRIATYIGGKVLEVGAGIGGTTRVLWSKRAESWLCLEPDANLSRTLASTVAGLGGGRPPEVVVGGVRDLDAALLFDCILYIDVLEHIEADGAELELAAAHLEPGGRLVVLSPAHQFLFSEFDKQIGHLRRYNRGSLCALGPGSLVREACFYLDSAGTVLSLANRLMLRSDSPTEAQILIWDQFVIPLSRILDWVSGYRLGKSIIAVWRRPLRGEDSGAAF